MKGNSKILFVSTNDWVSWGGSEELWYRTALKLKQLGADVSISVKLWDPNPAHIEKLEKAGCKIFYKSNKHPSLISRALKKVFKESFNPYGSLKDINPDLVIINQGSIGDGLEWAKECQSKNIRYGFIVQLVNELNVWDDEVTNSLISCFSKAQTNFFVSKQNIELFENIVGQRFLNSIVVQNPYRAPKEKSAYSKTEWFSLAFVASLNSFHKGHDLLFQVLRSEKWRKRNLKINLYGKGPNEQTLKRLKEQLHLDHVEFKGFEPDLKLIYDHNHAFILCSRMEGQSLAFLEAMYCNRMPIVTNAGGAKELVDDGINGFIADSANVKSIDEVLERAWDKREDWEEMGMKAGLKMRSVIQTDPVEAFANQLLKIANEIE